MARRTPQYYLIQVARVSGWLLFGLMLVYLVTGFALCRKFGCHHLLDKRSALVIHQIFDWPLLVVFVVHSGVTIYFAMRRWGWIRT